MNLTIRMKLLGLSILGLVFAVAVGIVGYWGVSRVDNANLQMNTTWRAARNHIEGDMMHDALRSDVFSALMSNSDHEGKQALGGIAEHAQWFRRRLEENKSLPLAPEVKKALEELGAPLEEYIASAEAMAQLAISDKRVARAQLPEFESVFKLLESRQSQVSDLIEKNASQSQQEGKLATDRAKNAIYVICGLSLVLLLACSLLIIRSITTPLQDCVRVVNEIAQGDLCKRLATDRHDEIGSLARAVNQMQDSLRNTLNSVASSAERVAHGSEELSAVAGRQAQGSETQRDQAAQVATAMQEMSATVLQVTQNSNQAASAAQQAADTARKGGQIVEQTLAKMRSIADTVGATAGRVAALGKSSDQIGEIVGVIDDIADQTNLLALNAAIEAARAGEQGRGFAVVADEVRKLAERTSGATKEIAGMIRGIQSDTRSAVEAMQAGTQQVQEGVETTSAAGGSLAEIIRMAERVGEMVTQIATASSQQAHATQEIGNSVEQISRVTHDSAAGAQQSARSCQELSGLALDLQKLVNQFKTTENREGASFERPGASSVRA